MTARNSVSNGPIRIIVVLATGLSLLWGSLGLSQETPAPISDPAIPTVETIEARIAAVDASTSLEESTKSRILELYTQSRETWTRSADWNTKLQDFDASIEEAPTLLETLQGVLDQPPSERTVEVPDGATVSQLNLLLSQEEAELARLRATASQLEGEPARRSERRRVVPKLLATARALLQEVEEQIQAAPPAEEIAELAEARSTNLLIRQNNRRLEVATYERELQSYDLRRPLMTLRIADASREAARQEKYVSDLRLLVSQRREQEALAASEQAQQGLREAAALSPRMRTLVEELAKENATLTEQWTGPDGLLQKIANAENERERVSDLLTSIQAEFGRIREKVDAAGSGEVVGLLLRQQEERLPSLRTYRRNNRVRENTLASIQIEQIELREQLIKTVDPKAELEQILEGIDTAVAEQSLEDATRVLEGLLLARQQNLEGLLDEFDRYFAALIELKLQETALISQTEEFQEYITQRVLFIRSGSWPNLRTLQDGAAATVWLGSISGWLESVQGLWSDFGQLPVLYLLVLLLLFTVVVIRGRVARMLKSQGVLAHKPSCTDMAHTFSSIGLTFLLALPLPVLLGFVGWRLSSSLNGGDFARCIGFGLLVASAFAGLMELIRHILRPNGIARLHFGWQDKATKRVRNQMQWAYPVVVSTVFVAWTVEASGDEAAKESLGRLSFSIAMIALLLFARRVLRPNGGALSQIIERVNAQARRRIRFPVQFAAFGIPGALLLMGLAGYYYTALRVSTRLYMTFFTILAVLFVAGVVLRWLQLAKRKLAREQGRQRRAALKAQAEATGETTAVVEDETVDLVKVDVQTQRLVRSTSFMTIILASWFIWSSMVPALNVLDSVRIGSTEVLVTDTTPVTDGAESSEPQTETRPITLRHLAVAIIIFLLTGAAARNIPGVLEIALLQRLRLASGERYAITTIVRYVLVGVGVVLAFRAIGIGWSNIQFLVAALGLGLGFGLQEIFANFVSGLILLFERPIRLGDTVTIGGVHGTVSRIRIRATTITDFDKKELIVPNKEFVTGQLINWTLSDAVLRVVIPVGVSYDSDTELVTKTLLRVAKDNPIVQDSPEPQALFLGFGDNTLNFELRVFCISFDNFMLLRHEMHMAIMKAFRELDIEIAFPQRDIHIRSIQDELPVIQRNPLPNGDESAR